MIIKWMDNQIKKRLAKKRHDVMKLRWEKERLKKELSQLKSTCKSRKKGSGDDYE